MSASEPVMLEKLINFIKNDLKSKSKINFLEAKTRNFIIKNKIVERKIKYEISSTLDIVNRYLEEFKKIKSVNY